MVNGDLINAVGMGKENLNIRRLLRIYDKSIC